ncbi:MAG: DUF2190 family protein [Acutalibacteraceae bacterium]|nr:DUF2190 family protein [Acutalibacteraceae bacterium]
MAKAIYSNRGESIEFLNSTDATLETGEIVSIGGTRVGVVGAAINAGCIGTVLVVGVYAMPKAAGAIEQGAALYYADGTVSASEGGVPCGWAESAANESAATVRVKIG